MIDEQKLRAVIQAAVRETVREELAKAPSREEYLDVAEAARVAAVSPGTIRLWVTTEKLHRCQAGREIRIARSELDRLLRSGFSETSGPAGQAIEADAVEFARRRHAG